MERGIDQGDSISPLLWVIYYNVLIQTIQQKCKGFTMSQSINNRLLNPTTQETMSISIPVMSFMDDTMWLASSKNELQEILSVAESFFQLMGIKVNAKNLIF